MAKRKPHGRKLRQAKSKRAKSQKSSSTPKVSSFQQQYEQIGKLIDEGNLIKAEPLCDALIRQHPDDLLTLKITGCLRHAQYRYMEAISLLEQVYTVYPQDIIIRKLLIASYQDGKQHEKAMVMARELLTHPLTLEETMLAFSVLQVLCDWQTTASIQDALIKKILAAGTGGIALGLSFLLALNGMDNVDPDIQFELHKLHGMIKPPGLRPRAFTPDQLNPQGRLKIAYISPDFNTHPVAYFIYPVLATHNRQNVEIYCYAHLARQDVITNKIRQSADHFIDITNMPDKEIAQRIRSDGIHVLVDLAGYSTHTRLPVLRWKPAPVQISWLGYPNTSGIPEIDFHITDHHAECEGGTRYMEELLYMPESFICFGMRPTCLRAETAPVESAGFITFGSFANTRKMNPRLIGAWSQILNQVPGSRMALKDRWACDKVRDFILAEFARHGVDDARLLFLPITDTYDEHVNQYNQIDIALDTFPYTGTTTTCEALLMGVPVVTLLGKTHANRVSYSILKNIGFETTIAETLDDYVEKAVALASNPGGLSMLRKTLPTLFEYSIVGQPERFTPQLEELYMDACRKKGVNLSALGTSTEMENAEVISPEPLNPNTYLAAFLRQRLTVPNITIAEIGARIINEENTNEPAELFHMLPEARVIAFEPDRDACEKVNLLADQFPANIQAYPYAVGGINGRQTLYKTNADMCSSLYKPNETLLRRFMDLEVSYLKDTCEIDVITLDAFMVQEDVDEIDFIKVDVQGAELDVFKGGEHALHGVIGICTKVEWAQLYENQPLFGDVDALLRQHGFQMHHILEFGGQPIRDTIFFDQQQSLWSDAIYFPGMEVVDTLPKDKLLKLAIMASMYNAYDLAQYVLKRYDTLSGSELCPDYTQEYVRHFMSINRSEKQDERQAVDSHQQNICAEPPAPTSRPADTSSVRKLHIGGKEKHPDWEILDAIPSDLTDHVGNANDLSMFSDNSFEAVYSSHVLEHFSYQGELPQVLAEWLRVLKPGGTIYASVPNLDVLCELFLNKTELSSQDRFMVMRMMFGGQIDPYDFHKVGYDSDILGSHLAQAGFENIRMVPGFELFNDTSNMEFSGKRISLNMIAEKSSVTDDAIVL